jgi:hypothetical protein
MGLGGTRNLDRLNAEEPRKRDQRRKVAIVPGCLPRDHGWSVFVYEGCCGAGPNALRCGSGAKGLCPEWPLVGPRESCGSVTRGYGWLHWICNSYPQGESGPEGCTKRCARAAAIKRASIQLLAVGPWREGRLSRWSRDFNRLKSSSICQRNR